MYTLAYDMPPCNWADYRRRVVVDALTQEFTVAHNTEFSATGNTLFIKFNHGHNEALIFRIGVSLGQLLMMSPS